MKYAIGPVLWYWPTDTLTSFYQQAADSSADIIYLGEAVCSKRRATSFAQWMEMGRTLTQHGKQVVLSTLALLQSPSEVKELRRYVENGEFLLEANDIGTVNMAAERKLPFVAGPLNDPLNSVISSIIHQLLGNTRVYRNIYPELPFYPTKPFAGSNSPLNKGFWAQFT